MKFLVYLFKLHLKIIYFFLKLFPTNDKKLLFLSRQYDNPSIDYLMLEKDIKKRYKKYNVVILCKTLNKKNFISYYFHLYKQMYHLATSKVCLVDTYIIPVSILKHKKNLTIIQLCHGIGNFKKFGYQTLKNESGRSEKLSKMMNMYENYDYLVSTSDKVSEFYSEAFNMDIRKMLNFGVPKIDYILNIKSKKREVLKKYPELKNKPVILFVCTFRTYKTDIISKFLENADFDKYNIILNIHPVMYKYNPEIEDTISDKRIFRCSEFKTVDLLSVCDIAITDYSSFAFESAILNIPTYFYIYDYEKYTKYNGLNVDVSIELPEFSFKDSKELFNSLDKNYNIKKLKEFRKKYVENCNGNATTLLSDFMIKKAKGD